VSNSCCINTTLTGSAAYAFAEALSWNEGLDEPFRGVIPFYAVVSFSTALGIALDVLNINPLKALFYTAVINGVLAPFLSHWHPRRGIGSQIDARSAELVAFTDPRRNNNAGHVWRHRRAVRFLKQFLLSESQAMPSERRG
jgi:hypothetical protein